MAPNEASATGAKNHFTHFLDDPQGASLRFYLLSFLKSKVTNDTTVRGRKVKLMSESCFAVYCRKRLEQATG